MFKLTLIYIIVAQFLGCCADTNPKAADPIVEETAILYPRNGDPDESIPQELVNLCLERFAYPYVSEVHQAWHCFNLLEQGPCDSPDEWFVVDDLVKDKRGSCFDIVQRVSGSDRDRIHFSGDQGSDRNFFWKYRDRIGILCKIIVPDLDPLLCY